MLSINKRFANNQFDASKYSKNWIWEEHLFDETIIAKLMSYAYSPVKFKNGQRRKANFIRSELCILDFDYGMDIDEAIDVFQDTKHIILTTKSHTPRHHRLRVVVPFEEAITDVDQFEQTMACHIQSHDSDEACKDAARFYWPCTGVVSTNFDEEAYCAEVLPKKLVIKRDPMEFNLESYRERPLRIETRELIERGATVGERNSRCFSAAIELYMKGFPGDTIKTLIFTNIEEELSLYEQDSILNNAYKVACKNVGAKNVRK